MPGAVSQCDRRALIRWGGVELRPTILAHCDTTMPGRPYCGHQCDSGPPYDERPLRFSMSGRYISRTDNPIGQQKLESRGHDLTSPNTLPCPGSRSCFFTFFIGPAPHAAASSTRCPARALRRTRCRSTPPGGAPSRRTCRIGAAARARSRNSTCRSCIRRSRSHRNRSARVGRRMIRNRFSPARSSSSLSCGYAPHRPGCFCGQLVDHGIMYAGRVAVSGRDDCSYHQI